MRDEWQTKTLGEVLKKTETVNPRQSPEREFDYIDVSSVSNLTCRIEESQRLKGSEAPSRARRLVRTNDVIFATVRPTLRRIAIVPEQYNGQVCSTGYFVLRPQDEIDHRFLFYFLLTEDFFRQMESIQTGASYPAVNDGQVRAQVISFPDTKQQRRIVGILDEAFDGIATAKANAELNLQNARALFESYLNAALSECHEGWVKTRLGDQVELLTGFPFKSAQYTNSEFDIRLLRGDNIVQGTLRWDDVKRWPASEVIDYEKYFLDVGDIVLAMDRPWVKAGLKRAQITSGDVPSLLVQRTSRLRGKVHLSNRFLLYLISSDAFTRHILGVQTGIGVPHISGKQIKDFTFIMPPKAEQVELVSQLDLLSDSIQRLESIYHRKLAALDELKKSLLHQAFSGQL